MSDEHTQVLAPATNGHAPASSVFGALKAKRAEYVSSETYDIDVPGYGGQLVLRLGTVSGGQLVKFAERREASKSPERDFNMSADLLLAACREVLWRETPESEPQPFDGDEPMLIDERLAAGLGLGASSGRELVRALFSAVPMPEMALGQALGAGYMEWASGVRSEADEEYVGESPAAPR